MGLIPQARDSVKKMTAPICGFNTSLVKHWKNLAASIAYRIPIPGRYYSRRDDDAQ